MKKKIEEKIETLKVKKHSEFKFAYIENCQNVAMALARSGYFINIRLDQSTYILSIYIRN